MNMDTAIVDPEKLQALAAMAPVIEQPSNPKARSGGNSVFDLPAFFGKHGIEVSRDGPHAGKRGAAHRWILPQCPFNPEHNRGEAVVIQDADGMIRFKCHHNSCDGKKWTDVRKIFEPGYREKKTRRRQKAPPPLPTAKTYHRS